MGAEKFEAFLFKRSARSIAIMLTVIALIQGLTIVGMMISIRNERSAQHQFNANVVRVFQKIEQTEALRKTR